MRSTARIIINLFFVLAAWSVQAGANPSLSVEEALNALGEGHALGPANAPVTIVEFTDFQCSYCRKFWSDTLPKLKDAYIEAGRVRFVYRHFAILGKPSEQAALAAECSGEQGKFWEYHDKLFANQGSLAFTNSRLKGYARELRLENGKFASCLDSARYRKKVEGETSIAALLGARGTPTFFVNGRLLVGAQPFEVFRIAVEKSLKSSEQGKKKKPA